jgi:cellulose synthase/poly-beta-1,6-N-acetylglucosamine synthase-like glycosyltransferase
MVMNPAAPLKSDFRRVAPLAFFGSLLICLGLSIYMLGIGISVVRLVLRLGEPWRVFTGQVIWYSGMPSTLGLLLGALDFALLLPKKRRASRKTVLPEVANRRVTVALTAYNDEPSIALAVEDFRGHPLVDRVIVVDNNSKDATSQKAREAGAEVVLELQPGYGRCVYRCYQEALKHSADLIVLCEGDCTFRAKDIDKLIAYIDHAHIVNGTRIVEQLREYSTQLSTFMYYGNFFVGKLLELKHFGQGTFTDVGTTYKLLRRDSLERLMPVVDPSVNLEFNAHFLDIALSQGERLVECPITFHPRVGVSKGGNTNNLRALKVGFGMIWGLGWGWK